MAVQLESAARLAALRDKADAVTGESSATLAGAVDALIAGFGAGGGGDTGGDTLGQYLADTLTEYTDNTAAAILNHSFRNLKTLRHVRLLAATSLGEYVFSNCTALETVELPNVTALGKGCFDSTTALKKLSLPKATSFAPYEFNTHGLELIDLPVVQSLPNNFMHYTRISNPTILLRSTAGVCALGGTEVFHNAKRICVPAALVDSYKVATNWTNFADKIVALEDFTVDGTTTGAFDESKL